jgi:hypothetical protein
MARKKNKKSSRKRRKDRKDAIPMSHVRKQIPPPGGPMEDKTIYKRTSKYKKDWK